MEISSIAINDAGTQIDLTITDAATVQSLRLWTDSTYKNFTQAIDLTSKLTGSATENISITLADISEAYFDGIYFVEAEDPNEASIDFTYNLTRYKECVVNRITYLSKCSTCILEEDSDLLSLSALLEGLQDALEIRFIDQILYFTDALNNYCEAECSTCGKFTNLTTGLADISDDGFTINIDGGSLD